MRKGFFLIGFLIACAIAYHFYQQRKSDTLVIAPMHRIGIPDSSWIYGSVNIQQIKKDVAWSSLLNGDFLKLFKTDTGSNTLIKLFKSPSDYSIVEQNNILFFSEWKYKRSYSGILLKLKNAQKISKAFKSDSIQLNQQYVCSFRTSEGLWMYNDYNLIYIATQENDSIYACNLFNTKTINITEPTASDSVLARCAIQSIYAPDSLIHPVLDSTQLIMLLKSNNDVFELEWNYTGAVTNLLTQSIIKVPSSTTGVFVGTTLTAKGIYNAFSKTASLSSFFTKHKKYIDVIATTLDSNSLAIEFNGWKKIKSSYYTSVMNDEFEMVMQKKDTNIIEPIFKICLEQKSTTQTNTFLNYLKKEGLVTKVRTNVFDVILGNFDSNIQIEDNHSIVFQNKHINISKNVLSTTLNAAFYLSLKPAAVNSLFNSKIQKDLSSKHLEYLNKVDDVRIHINKDNQQLNGHTWIRFKEKKHPLISFIELLKQ